MPIYTGTGDDGHTGLFGNRRVHKDHDRIEAYGTIDELNAMLGLVRSDLAASTPADAEFDRNLATIQATLFDVGADLATEGGRASLPRVATATTTLERWIDASEQTLPALRSFVLPGGCRLAASLHVARTVARRAERRFWTLARACAAGPAEQRIPIEFGVYLNRLSDLLFSWARRANARDGTPDVPWTRD